MTEPQQTCLATFSQVLIGQNLRRIDRDAAIDTTKGFELADSLRHGQLLWTELSTWRAKDKVEDSAEQHRQAPYLTDAQAGMDWGLGSNGTKNQRKL